MFIAQNVVDHFGLVNIYAEKLQQIKIKKMKVHTESYLKPRNYKRDQYKAYSYRKHFGNRCMNPDCTFGFNPETHHIVPLYKGGIDEIENFIVLCSPCHRLARRHSKSDEQEIILATWKYYFESLFEAALQGNEIAKEKIEQSGLGIRES